MSTVMSQAAEPAKLVPALLDAAARPEVIPPCTTGTVR